MSLGSYSISLAKPLLTALLPVVGAAPSLPIVGRLFCCFGWGIFVAAHWA